MGFPIVVVVVVVDDEDDDKDADDEKEEEEREEEIAIKVDVFWLIVLMNWRIDQFETKHATVL